MNIKIVSELKQKAKEIHDSIDLLDDKYKKLHSIAHNAETKGVENAWELIIGVLYE